MKMLSQIAKLADSELVDFCKNECEKIIMWQTREHGIPCLDRPGKIDIKIADNFVSKIKKLFPDAKIKRSTADEWVFVVLEK